MSKDSMKTGIKPGHQIPYIEIYPYPVESTWEAKSPSAKTDKTTQRRKSTRQNK